MAQRERPMQFPQYRKYTNGGSYFKILSDREFIEIQIVGGKVLEHRVMAHQFPERRMIQDMLEMAQKRWETISAIEFEKVENGL